jgi:hypothetical protein
MFGSLGGVGKEKEKSARDFSMSKIFTLRLPNAKLISRRTNHQQRTRR